MNLINLRFLLIQGPVQQYVQLQKEYVRVCQENYAPSKCHFLGRISSEFFFYILSIVKSSSYNVYIFCLIFFNKLPFKNITTYKTFEDLQKLQDG